MICPNCQERYPDYEAICPACRVPLVQRLEGVPEPDPDIHLVRVFETHDAGSLPLAELTLREADIEYIVRRTVGMPRAALRQGTTDFNTPVEMAEIVVASDVADRARDLLIDLESASSPLSPTEPEAAARQATATSAARLDDDEPADDDAEATIDRDDLGWDPRAPIHLTDRDTHMPIGTITAAQLQTLIDLFEEESSTSQHYYIDENTIDMLMNAQPDAELVNVLRAALGTRDGMDIEWARG